jgi:SAM-dependent methyltransferase
MSDPKPDPSDSEKQPSAQDVEYAERLVRLQSAGWKRILDVQAPYRWNLRRLEPGFTLELGCGIGRNLEHLGGAGVGIDQNASCVQVARSRGYEAFTPEQFRSSEHAHAGCFDSLLLSHVAEHIPPREIESVLAEYLAFVRPGGKLILITPQEVGYRSDATHVHFYDFDALSALGRDLGLAEERSYSFPFPRPAGRVFIYNEFVWTGRLP